VLAGSLALSIDGIDADDLCLQLARDVQLSTGSACTSGQLRVSHVLEAMGYSEDRARHVLRAFCHRYLCPDDITRAARQIAGAALRRSELAAGGLRQ
jgi:cysteine desulfurase